MSLTLKILHYVDVNVKHRIRRESLNLGAIQPLYTRSVDRYIDDSTKYAANVMKPGAPWSVKGIKPEARTSAKEAARKSGMTLGQWLNHIIEDAAEGDDTRNVPADPQDRNVSDLHETLGQMATRFEQSDQTLQQVSSRLSKFEDLEPSSSEGFDALSSLQESQERLLERIESIEQVASQTQPEGLGTGLEETIERLTTHIERSENQSLSGMQTIQKALGHLVGRMEAVEQDKNTSAELIGTALQHITSRLEDKENNETLLLRAIDSLNKRVEQMESNSGESGGDIKKQLEDLARTIETATQSQQTSGSSQALNSALQRIALLETSFDRLALKFESSKAEQDGTLGQIQSQLTQISQNLSPTEPASSLAMPADASAEADSNAPDGGDTDDIVDLDAIIEDFHNRAAAESKEETSDTDVALATTSDEEAKDPKTQPESNPTSANKGPAGQKTKGKGLARTAAKKTDTQPNKTSTTEVLPPWLRSDEEIADQKPLLKRKILLSIIGIAFVTMAAAAVFILRSEIPGLERFWNAEDRPGLSTIFGDLNSVADRAEDEADLLPEAETAANDLSTTMLEPLIASGNIESFEKYATSQIDELKTEAEAGEPHAQYMLAIRYFLGQDTEKDRAIATSWFEKAGAAGLAPAQYRAGVSYERGQGVEPNREKAMTWYEAAAGLGHRKAMYNLAVMYADGLGGGQDFGQAAKWFEGAANLGLLDAQFNLGIIHAQGLAGEPDLVSAYKWFSIAAAGGDAEATNRLEELTLKLNQNQIDLGRTQLSNWRSPGPDPYVNFEPGT